MTISSPKSSLKRYFFGQLRLTLVVLALAVFVYLGFGKPIATSMLAGAMCALIPHSVLIWYVFRFRGELDPQRVLQSVYRGESLKFLATALMVAVALKHGVLIHWVFFCGLVATLIAQAVLPFLINYENWD